MLLLIYPSYAHPHFSYAPPNLTAASALYSYRLVYSTGTLYLSTSAILVNFGLMRRHGRERVFVDKETIFVYCRDVWLHYRLLRVYQIYKKGSQR